VLSVSVLTLGEDLFIISIDGWWAIRGMTAAEGPIIVGYNHGDLTDAEIAEFLSVNVTDPDDIIANERRRRPVRKAGQFGVISPNEVLNHGEPLRTPMKFSIGDGHTFDIWARNESGGTLTTGGVVEIHGNIYGRWQR